MTKTPERVRILQACVDRLGLITTANGYETDAGLLVTIGELIELGADDPDVAISVVPGDDTKTFDAKKSSLELPIELQAVTKVGPSDALLKVEYVLADIKRAFETEDRRLADYPILRGATRRLEREAGSNVGGVGVTYTVQYSEAWGNP